MYIVKDLYGDDIYLITSVDISNIIATIKEIYPEDYTLDDLKDELEKHDIKYYEIKGILEF